MDALRDLHAHITGSIDANAMFKLIEEAGLQCLDADKIDSLTAPFGIKLAQEMKKDLQKAKAKFKIVYPCSPDGTVKFDQIMQRFLL